jgi:hypothetical protein
MGPEGPAEIAIVVTGPPDTSRQHENFRQPRLRLNVDLATRAEPDVDARPRRAAERRHPSNRAHENDQGLELSAGSRGH